MEYEKVEVSPDQVPAGQSFELALVVAVERLVAAVERIEVLLARRPVLSRRQSALVDLLGDAARVVVLSPAPEESNSPLSEHSYPRPHGPNPPVRR